MKELYEVEWIASVPEDDNGDADMDRAVYKYKRFPTRALAEVFAQRVIVGLPFEVAYIRPVRELSSAEVRAWADEGGPVTDWWREGTKLFGYVGDAVEVST